MEKAKRCCGAGVSMPVELPQLLCEAEVFQKFRVFKVAAEPVSYPGNVKSR